MEGGGLLTGADIGKPALIISRMPDNPGFWCPERPALIQRIGAAVFLNITAGVSGFDIQIQCQLRGQMNTGTGGGINCLRARQIFR